MARYNATIRFLLFLFFLFFRESFASFTRGTRGIPCKVQPPSLDPCEVSETKSRGEWSRKELSDCRHLRDGLSLINGSNIPPYTDDPGIGDTILVIYKHRSPMCVCVRVCTCAWWMFLLLQHPEPTQARTFYRRISADLRPSWKL